MKRRPLYIETHIACDLDSLWARTQDPGLHQLWDLRFSRIEYLPKPQAEARQTFLYSTQIGFGLKVDGVGESVATKTSSGGESTSVLKFSSEHPMSIIRRGSGYWKYQPDAKGVRFFTGYDYETRWGLPGALIDRWIFRPMMVWATAWSFDRLKNWIEKDVHPKRAFISQATVTLASLALGSVWIYQGLVPKLLFADTGEMELMAKSGLFPGREAAVLTTLGIGEILFGLCLCVFQSRRLHWANLLALPALAAGALFSDPGIFLKPFNPFTFNLALMALSAAALLNAADAPRASNCRTRPEK
jgi:hypothetical protein